MALLPKVLLILTFSFFLAEGQNEATNLKTEMTLPVVGSDSPAKPDLETKSVGSWGLISKDSGVSAMHVNLMPTNKMMVYDATIYRLSRLKYPAGVPCVRYEDDDGIQLEDCYAHAMEYDIKTNQVRPLKVSQEPWCSCGGLAPDGTLVSSGGFDEGEKTVRYIGGNCKNNCEWREYAARVKDPRWYATQVLLPNGEFIVIGGRKAYSYEFLPKEGATSEKPYFFPFLYETSDIDENNLYPFVHLSVDGNLFIFANNRSLLLNPSTNKVVRTFPVLPGGSRNYPASGMSVMFPLQLDNNGSDIKVEVLVCGGNTHDSFYLAETKKVFVPALQDCNRMVITDPNPAWETENMPSRRTMGDALILPNGQVLFINGAQNGTAAWWDADVPNLTPVLYSPDKPKGQRFKELVPTQIARMYHSTAALLPSAKIWVAGSNTHNTYKDNDKFPTETRVEAFSPPYLDQSLDRFRPRIIANNPFKKRFRYGAKFAVQFTMPEGNEDLSKNDFKVTMYFPPFTTHGFSMNQRLLVLKIWRIVKDSKGVFRVRLQAPPSSAVAPPGHYLLFVVHRNVPSEGMWVHIQ